MEEQTVQKVRALLAEAGDAHKVFERDELKGGSDEDWPGWYARYLLDHGLRRIVGREIGANELANLLRACDEAYRRDQPPESWPEYYAPRIIEAA